MKHPASIYGHAGLCSVLILLVAPAASRAEEPDRKPDDDPRQAIVRAARDYKLYLGPERRRLEFVADPVLRWPNPTREVPEGATFIWTLDGRPEAIGCIWQHAVLCHAFQSLSGEKLLAEHGGQTVWQPTRAGIELQDFPESPTPADSAAKRLNQMKELARRFHCRLGDGRKGEDLRLLTSPLYRYKTNRKDLIDGALFAYVQGTDPEVVLVLEAHRRDGKSAWKYALTRRSMLALEADLDGERIWAVPHTPGSPDEAWFQGGILTR